MQDDLIELDKRYYIHPVINYRAHEKRGATIIKSGDGAYLTDIEGNTLLDAFSGLWCVNTGYGHESIVEAAQEQMRTLPYATGYFHFASEPAIKLAAKLVEITPSSLQHVFFSMGGSDAVDSAIRFIVHYFNSLGKPTKKQFISIERGYHGSSSQGAGLTALPVFHNNFDLPLPNQHKIACPYSYRLAHGHDADAVITESVAALKSKVDEIGVDNVAAFFCEPIIGSGGVIVPPKGWLKAMQECCNELGILFVVDEVITGFGRTGTMFASEAEDVQPDLMTVAKGLTAGYAPMGAVMMSDHVYQTIAGSESNSAPVGHGFTYSAHPVSAAIALEVIRLYEEGGLLENAQKVAPFFEQGLQALLDHPLVGDARSRGLLGALELVCDKQTKAQFDPSLKLPEKISDAAYKNRVIFRSFADGILGFAPALCYREEDFAILFERVKKTLDEVLADPDVQAAIS
ncbi:aminotransferase class III-fold pyridoxal phosphate-dependent enzyme [Marinomonas mediterranea]|uniref:aspartate aminotransferase family protein n=1 Tax=Marinomonas mediterranea TaxID=119864 RepID=UPI00234BD548|nr:aspartate aminotransferase family protein [Marinomonas mediterranea]WCN13726.1 aminotransferase class III-fold pyridoxal phosphate-dependent enzyme [Marinomonas mediterranea]